MTEFVVGFHLIVDPEKVLWLERASYPVVSDTFIDEIGAELKRDDDLFNAVLVSFGSLGIVAGIMIETETKYLFEVQRTRIQKKLLQNAMDTMQFDNHLLPSPNRPGDLLWHFEVTFNPMIWTVVVMCARCTNSPIQNGHTRTATCQMMGTWVPARVYWA